MPASTAASVELSTLSHARSGLLVSIQKRGTATSVKRGCSGNKFYLFLSRLSWLAGWPAQQDRRQEGHQQRACRRRGRRRQLSELRGGPGRAARSCRRERRRHAQVVRPLQLVNYCTMCAGDLASSMEACWSACRRVGLASQPCVQAQPLACRSWRGFAAFCGPGLLMSVAYLVRRGTRSLGRACTGAPAYTGSPCKVSIAAAICGVSLKSPRS